MIPALPEGRSPRGRLEGPVSRAGPSLQKRRYFLLVLGCRSLLAYLADLSPRDCPVLPACPVARWPPEVQVAHSAQEDLWYPAVLADPRRPVDLPHRFHPLTRLTLADPSHQLFLPPRDTHEVLYHLWVLVRLGNQPLLTLQVVRRFRCCLEVQGPRGVRRGR